MKLTKQDFSNNKYNLMLCAVYSGLLAVIYGWWAQAKLNIWWVTLIIVIAFIIGGFCAAFICTYVKVKQNKE